MGGHSVLQVALVTAEGLKAGSRRNRFRGLVDRHVGDLLA
jgi:hypothetical protein